MKRIIFLAIILVFALALSACGGQTGYAAEAPGGSGEVTLEAVVRNPEAFVSDTPMYLTGFVTNVDTRFFYIQNAEGTAELMVDYRGVRAFPQEGEEISIRGVILQNCCNPELVMLRASRFTLVQP